MRTRALIKRDAKDCLKGNLLRILGVAVLLSIITMVISNIPSAFGIETIKTTNTLFGETKTTTTFGLFWNFIISVIGLSLNYILIFYCLKIKRKENVDLNQSFGSFFKNLKTIVLVAIVCSLCIDIGFILFIIPGIIVALGLNFCNYVIVDNENIKTLDVIKNCWKMMQGHKFELFVYILSFMGWYLLCIFILPIIYVIPYFSLVMATYYDELKTAN